MKRLIVLSCVLILVCLSINVQSANAYQWVSGIDGSGISMEGNDYLKIPHSESLSSPSWTVSLWISMEDLLFDKVDQVFIDKRHGPYHRNYSIVYYNSETIPHPKPRIDVIIGDGDNNYFSGSGVDFNANEFHHVAATYDQSYLKLYIDGTEVSSEEYVYGSPVGDITGTGALHIGAHGEGDTIYNHILAIIDEVHVYNVALSSQQIQSDMTAPPIDPVGWWKLNEGEGRAIFDSSANSNDGRIYVTGEVPLPAAVWLLGSGLLGLAGLRRKLRK